MGQQQEQLLARSWPPRPKCRTVVIQWLLDAALPSFRKEGCNTWEKASPSRKDPKQRLEVRSVREEMPIKAQSVAWPWQSRMRSERTRD